MSSEALYLGREESFRYDLLDLNDKIIGKLASSKTGGRLDFSIAADIRGSGSIDTVVYSGIAWEKVQVRVSYIGAGRVEPLITAIPKAPQEDHDDDSVEMSIELYDKTLKLKEDSFGYPYGLNAGSNILEAVKDVIESTGERGSNFIYDQNNTSKLSTPVVWDPSYNKLQIVNNLLDSAGFFSIYTDGLGRFRADKYVEPSSRPVSWQFEYGKGKGLYLPKFNYDLDRYNIPNKYIVIGKSVDDAPAPVAWAEDNDPESPFSFVNRGRWVTKTDTDVDAADADTLLVIAKRRLESAQQITGTLSNIKHPWLPFGMNSIVTFSNKRIPIPIRAVCQKQSITLNAGGLVTSTLRGLSSGN